MNKYKAIIYDIDGTLLDTFPMNFYPLTRIVKEELNIDMTYEEALAYVAYPGMETLRILGIKDIDHVYARWVRYVNDYEPAKPYEGIAQLLKACDGQIQQAIATSKKRRQYHIDMAAFEHFFHVAVLEEDTIHHKPDPEPLLKAVELLHLTTDDVIYIGDSYTDYEAACNAHIDFGHARWGSLINQIDGATYVFDQPEDILSVL
ncbi:MAG: HAD-IA family hydrolase [Erysipelotrichaceae bacterium]|nr:HAD-IA family hydrolase [Erysipelotrichaceae bacterium]